jgi:hypothetical protein
VLFSEYPDAFGFQIIFLSDDHGSPVVSKAKISTPSVYLTTHPLEPVLKMLLE